MVVALVGILSGILIGIVNPRRQNEIAQDGVRISNLQRLYNAIEAYNAGEGSYPANNNGAPQSTTLLSKYLSNWPGSPYTYYTVTEGSINFVCLSVQKASDTTRYFKIINIYDSSYTGGRPECAGVVLDCPSNRNCVSGGLGNDIGTCVVVQTGVGC
ncbi:MAG: hypothetical protein KatS3mg101_0420 [Patescibacteria group bacterium]|nr:MAG: hypothetical protein KatS3mg101_0420 [Patescibacteria group bacterium]